MITRLERPGDESSIRDVNVAAFPMPAEADLVDRLRTNDHLAISLVAVENDRIVGHVAFSPISVDQQFTNPPSLGLAPAAVLPKFQRQGIGAALIQAGLEACRKAGAPAVVVLGEPEYYGRFGFQTASRFGIGNEYGVDTEFMVLFLSENASGRPTGRVAYSPEFAEL